MYIVFRKNDGYVGAITAETPMLGRQRLVPFTSRGGEQISYEILLETNAWPEAQARITAEREREATT